jgi:hypothetical protein
MKQLFFSQKATPIKFKVMTLKKGNADEANAEKFF